MAISSGCCGSSFATAMAMTSAMNLSSRASTTLIDSSADAVCALGAGNARFGFECTRLRSNSARRSGSSSSSLRKANGGRFRTGGRECVGVRAEGEGMEPERVTRNEQLAYDGPGKGGQWLSATTRHVRIYVGVADPVTMALDQSQLDKLTLMLDPDNEFVWPDDKVQKVYDYFTELVENYAGADCTEYTLRLIGSDIEHFIRKMLLANEIKYNLECGVLNFSMGQPRYDPAMLEGVEAEAE
ncbi:hypothetical protein Mapa_008142 [Marchantia paleacea]|nr:hypothetical protein Mapa_008142 [Marchantia paleacea]